MLLVYAISRLSKLFLKNHSLFQNMLGEEKGGGRKWVGYQIVKTEHTQWPCWDLVQRTHWDVSSTPLAPRWVWDEVSEGVRKWEGGCFVFTGLPMLCLWWEAAAFYTLFRMGLVGCSYWNTKYSLGNEGESASVYFLNVGKFNVPKTEGDRWPSEINCT